MGNRQSSGAPVQDQWSSGSPANVTPSAGRHAASPSNPMFSDPTSESTAPETVYSEQTVDTEDRQDNGPINEINELKKRLRASASENATLRNIIAGTRNPPGPTKDEAYYRTNLLEVKETIESLVDGIFAKETIKPASNHSIKSIIDIFDATNPRWKEYSYNDLLFSLASRTDLRIPLARHILTLMLWEPVFHPFCFGIPDELSRLLKSIVRSARHHGISPPRFC